jgi:hypothetical protein
MSDFLSHLASRSLTGTGHTRSADLRARVPALFEPVRESDGLLAGRQAVLQDAVQNVRQDRSVATQAEVSQTAIPSPSATFASTNDSPQQQTTQDTNRAMTIPVEAARAEPAKSPHRETSTQVVPRQPEPAGVAAVTADTPPIAGEAFPRVSPDLPSPSAPASRVSVASAFLPEQVRPVTEAAGNSSQITREPVAAAAPVIRDTSAAADLIQPLSARRLAAPSRSPTAEDAALLPGRETAALGEWPIRDWPAYSPPGPNATSSRQTAAPDGPRSVRSEDQDRRPVLDPAQAPIAPAAAAKAAMAQAQPASPKSSIQVTIGRVEVRAVFPPQPAARSQPAPRTRSTLSLDEYLKRGSGAGR